ncbi:helix-turn-helix domain-containing protein [Rhizobium sp. L1K21]|uniref:helix-turn-helix domain-containing protein n=1 Tax=Rhizobium sp. L1K21 TaxID=2954933 RepID=UPI002092ED27|nr:helix-turn-helix domain-containing protein [Rhizobium sp. L1K21]MCO6185450.1 helix-turn-helix domain-containing protein [Rhizobium sp. L1K21]
MEGRGIGVTIYALFGEEEGSIQDPEFIHIEDIKSRSRLYEWRISTHAHNRMFQIIYIASGGVAMRMEGKASKIKGPCAITIPPGAVHSFAFQPETVGYVLTAADTLLLDARFIRSRPLIEPLLSEPKSVEFHGSPQTAAFAENLFVGMLQEFSQAMPGRSSMLDWLLRSILLTVARQVAMTENAAGRRGPARERFSDFLKLVEDHYRSHLTVQDYADKMAMSAARLNRLCKSVAGKPAQEIIHARVVLEAQRLLTYTSATSAEVAYELGFRDPAYFTRFFRRETGVTPSTFRQDVE